nr:hypothetical protein [Tanacetum cinerariifolium]
MESQSETTQTVSALKLLVIVNSDLVSPVASASAGAKGPSPPKTAEQKLARKNKLKAKSTLILAIPDKHLLKFHACKDAKSLWEAINNRFKGNKESKKMQKTILKQNYINFAASIKKGLDKTYDRFQKLISQLEIHGEVISQEDANMKLLRSLPSAWDNIALIMRNKSNLDTLSIDLNDNHVSEREVLDNVFNSMIDSRERIRDDNQVNNRFKKGKGYHAVSPPYTGNYMPLRADLSFLGLDDYVFKSKESDIEDGNVFKTKEVKKTVKPSLEKIEFVNARNTTVENENKAKKPRKFSQSPRGNKRNWNGLMTQRLGDGFKFKKKSCFVCGSFNHLTKDCDFYENKMIEKSVLNNKGKITGPKEIRPVWDNTARVNHQSKLTHPHPKRNIVPVAVLTKSRQVPVNAAKQSFHRATTLVSAARRVNTAATRQMLKVVVSAAEGNRDNAVKSSACWIWRPKRNLIDHISKYSGSYTLKRFKCVDPQGRLKSDQEFFDSGCSRHMTGNKSYLTDYQEINGGFVVFGRNVKGGNQTYTNAGPKSSEDEVVDDAKKKGTEVPRKENGLQDPAKEGDKNDQEKLVKEQEEAIRKQFEQEFKRLFGQREVANTNITNKLNTISSPDNHVSSSFTTVDPGRERAQRNELESTFGQDKDANGNSTYRMFTPVNSVGSFYVNLSRSIPVNAVTLPNADLPTDPFMPDLEDTADLQDTRIIIGAYDDEVEGVVVVFNNLEPITVVIPIPTTKIHKDHLKEQNIEDLLSALQTRRMTKTFQEHAMCGNDLRNGFCSLCNSGNSYVYDPNPNSFDCPPDSYHSPYPTYETYSYESYGNNSQFGYDCQPQFPLHYESEQGYNENYTSYPYDSLSLPQQYFCCARCGGPHETCQCDQLIFDEPYCKHCGGPHMIYQCQLMNQDSYNSNYLGFDQPQPAHSGSTTTSPDISLSEYEAFHEDHVKEISSGSPTTHSDSPLYASFMFDLSINPFPPADRSDSYEFTDEIIPFISAPEYDCFRFKVEPNSRDFTKDVV